MNTEKTHFRTIPEEEYQKLKALAEGNQRAIEEIFNDSEFAKEFKIIKEQFYNSKHIIREFFIWFDDIFDIIKEEETLKKNYSLRFRVKKIIELKEKLK